jgi:hypothetical protein
VLIRLEDNQRSITKSAYLSLNPPNIIQFTHPSDQSGSSEDSSLLAGALGESLEAFSIAHNLAGSTAANEEDAGEISGT